MKRVLSRVVRHACLLVAVVVLAFESTATAGAAEMSERVGDNQM